MPKTAQGHLVPEHISELTWSMLMLLAKRLARRCSSLTVLICLTSATPSLSASTCNELPKGAQSDGNSGGLNSGFDGEQATAALSLLPGQASVGQQELTIRISMDRTSRPQRSPGLHRPAMKCSSGRRLMAAAVAGSVVKTTALMLSNRRARHQVGRQW